jgi:hypothetical protein
MFEPRWNEATNESAPIHRYLGGRHVLGLTSEIRDQPGDLGLRGVFPLALVFVQGRRKSVNG